MRLSERESRRRFTEARHAYLATVGDERHPHLVPVTFAATARVVVTAVDHKPKISTDLRRLRNIRHNGRVSLLVDGYDDRDWTRLWWVRADGTARVLTQPAARAEPVRLLRDKYPQYADRPPEGPVIQVEVHTWRGWSYS